MVSAEGGSPPGGTGRSRFVAELESAGPTVSVELRPPRSGLARGGAMDMWIDLSHSIRRIVALGGHLMLTDSAVGQEEEENLQHLAANLAGEVDARRIVPFLTCKHPLEYCLRYGERARARGLESLTVVGGDETGPPRCLPHAYLLRKRIRAHVPDLSLGGWLNPHADPERQAGFVLDAAFQADYLLTQIVSHHDLPAVEGWLRAAEREGIELPTSFGVFYYRNGKRDSLERLSRFFPVPVKAVASAFEDGATPEGHCAQTIIALRRVGARNVYVCNLGARHAATLYDRILREVDALSGSAG